MGNVYIFINGGKFKIKLKKKKKKKKKFKKFKNWEEGQLPKGVNPNLEFVRVFFLVGHAQSTLSQAHVQRAPEGSKMPINPMI